MTLSFVIPWRNCWAATLVEDNNTRDECYVDSVGQTLVMHIARMELSPPTTNALPKWRLKRVQDYVEAHSDKALTLADFAAVAGLSRMYFAGQFRAATGYASPRLSAPSTHRKCEVDTY